MNVLIFSELGDVHAIAVMEALAARGDVKAEMLDLSKFPTELSVTMDFEGIHRSFRMRKGSGWELDFSSIDSVWWRRPQAFVPPPATRDSAHLRFVRSECYTAMQGLYQSMDAFWINEPARDAQAIHKPWQLTVAQEIGLDIPVTMMTNDPTLARSFWAEHDGNVVYKQFLALPDAWRETRRLRSEDAALADAVQHAPVIFQRFVEADLDIRATIVDDEIFAASTDVRHASYPADVRFNLDAQYSPYELPSDVADKLLSLVRRLGLVYGAIDLRRTLDGRHVFLEINPSGQFLYIELMTGQKIAASLAACLARGRRALP